MTNRFGLAAVAALLLSACGPTETEQLAEEAASAPGMSEIAERYVKLVLAVGEHEPGYVDAYYGPNTWAEEVKAAPPALADLETEAGALITALQGATGGDGDLADQRIAFLSKQLVAVEARIRMIAGEKFTFDEETALLYDAVSPGAVEAELDVTLAELDALVPGDGPLDERFVAFREHFVVPPDRLDAVFQAAMAACREKTAEYLDLPEGESFTTEYVTDQSWSGYNWYQGNANSLIQVNTDFPIFIDRAVDLGCHEGYPGHHVFNAMLERRFVDELGWMEYSVYPLYSPQSLLAEGTANFGIEMAFPGEERLEFETETLYPLAGIDPDLAGTYERAQELMRAMRYARTEGARRYLDGRMTRDQLIDWLARYQLTSRERAEQGVRFIETYRGYVINYTLGADLSAAFVDRLAGDTRADRWRIYTRLLSEPLTASAIVE